MSTPPPGHHPGYGPNPPGAQGAQGQPAQPGQQGQPGQQARHPGYPDADAAPGTPVGHPARNPLGLASLIVGALVPLSGIVFALVQATAIRFADPGVFGGISATSNVLGGLLGVVALVLGLIAISRRGLSKTLAAAGIALGAAALVGVFGTVLYTVVVAALYG